MKLRIIVYYDKDKKHLDDYIIKRVIIKDEQLYSIKSYYMINGVIKEYTSKIKMDEICFKKYLTNCKKSDFYNKTVYEFITGGNLK